MASGKGNVYSNDVLNFLLGGATFTVPGTLYLALFTVTPSGSGGGTEVSGGSYGRVAITNNTTSWPTTSTQTKQNANAVTFAQASANWGTIVAAALMDASTGGNIIYWGAVTVSQAINNGDTATLPANAITVTEA